MQRLPIMWTRSLWIVVVLLFGASTASTESRTAAEARRLFPRALAGWSAGSVNLETHAVLDQLQTVVTRTYTKTHDTEQVTITIDTYNPITTAFILGVYGEKADTPVTRAGMRRFEIGKYKGVASGPEENPNRVMLVIDGSVVVTIARQGGASDALVWYLYAIDAARIQQFARSLSSTAARS